MKTECGSSHRAPRAVPGTYRVPALPTVSLYFPLCAEARRVSCPHLKSQGIEAQRSRAPYLWGLNLGILEVGGAGQEGEVGL